MQRSQEWNELNESDLGYHEKQWLSDYRSTMHFAAFIRSHVRPEDAIVDLGCGGGGATYSLARKFKHANFLGLDISSQLIQMAKRKQSDENVVNLSFDVDDWFDLRKRDLIDGVVSLQTLSWLPDYRAPLDEIANKMQPKWMAFSSLFYAGDISCKIEVTQHQRNKNSFYNIYSVPEIARWAEAHDFRFVKFEKFEIDIDLIAPASVDSMGTYTQRVLTDAESFRRIQISGPLLMNWGFILLERLERR